MATERNGDPPVPDLRTMEELCQPSLNGRGGLIAPIAIQATNFGLKNDMIQQVWNSCQFHGLPGDDVNKHLDKFLHVTQSIKVNGVTDDALYLYLFPHSLTHHAIAWFDRLLRNSINTFEQMAKMFLEKYFPPSMVTKLRNEITNFCQRPDESLFKAWKYYKLSIDRCPNHNMLLVTQIDTFYNSLTLRHHDTINVVGGTFMKRRPKECYDLIENMTAHQKDWDTSAQWSESSSSITSSSDTEIEALKAEMAEINKIHMRVLQVNQKVKAITPNCETCGGPHSYSDCPATVGQTQNVYAVGAYQIFNQNQNRSNPNQNFHNQNMNQGNHNPQGKNQGRNQFFQGALHGQNLPLAYQEPAYQAPAYQTPVHQPQIPQPQVVTTNELTNFMKANDVILKNMQTNMTSLKNSNLELKNMFGQFMKMNTASSSGSGSLPSNTITNLKEDLKGITTHSGTTYPGPTIPTTSFSSSSPVVERETEVTKDMLHPTNNRSTKDVQPLVVPFRSPILNSNPVVAPIIEPRCSLVSAPKPNLKPSIPYPSRLHDHKLRDKANDQKEKFFQIFKDLNFNISFADALILMPKFGPSIKTLLTNKDKHSELARTSLNEHCLAVLLKKLPQKLGDPNKFLIPCDFTGMVECLALADLSASINLMPLSMWNKLSLLDFSLMCMTLELVDRLISRPVGVAEYVFVKVGTFPFLADFVVIDFDVDPRVPLILERSFLKTERALIDVFEGELTLRIGKEAITFNLDQTSRYSASYNDMTVNRIDVIDMACEEYSQEFFSFFDVIMSGNPTPYYDPIVSTTSLTLTPFGESDFLLEEVDAFLALDDDPTSPKVDQSYVDTDEDILLFEAFLNDDPSLPPLNQRNYLPEVRKELKICDAKSNKSSINEPPEINYPISDSPWVSPVHCVPKKGGFTVVENEENELIPTRLVMGWRVCIDYQKLNEATGKDHFPLSFMDLMLERLAGNQYYCFLDGFLGYFQIPIDPKDQEKNTFMCPYGTFAYRRMSFGLCNAPGTFQRCMMAIFHDMIEKTMEVFMDDFSVFRNSFQTCLFHLEKMLKRCEDTNLCLNWEKSHFIVKEGIVLDHKISKDGIEVDKSKVKVIAKLPHPTTFKGIRSFFGNAGFYRRFIKDFSKIARPMTRLLEKDTLFLFSKECVEAFKTLKRKLTKALILIALDWDMPFKLMCDASDFAIGAVLGQRQEKHFRPIHYASKTMTEAESNYTITKKEMLAVVYAFEKFWSYLILNKSIVYTDHFALKYLFAKKDSKAGLLRWVLLLQEFTFKVIDTKGAENLATDHLSRLESLHQNVLDPKEINESFPLETLNMVSFHDDALWAFRITYKTPIECTPYKLVYGKTCHLLIELEHKAYWALKHANFDILTAGDHRKVQLNELRDQAYENSLIYKEKTKRLHDSKIKDCVFNIGDRVLLFILRLKIFSGKLKSCWSGSFTISRVFPYGTVELS
nr:reverse transcriptase domain-containing protein [Tanacetum cinerariifolium]